MFSALVLATGLLAQTTNVPPATADTTPNPVGLREVAPGILDYHGVRLDKKDRRVSFDAAVNQHNGLIEYLLVNDKGKVHESLLATKILPHDIHLGLLLIGLQEGKRPNVPEPLPPSAIDSAYLHAAPKIKGTPVLVTVAWTQDGKRHEAPADSWIFNLHTNQLMSPGPWTYNGSVVEDGIFVADQELSIVAVITDPTALANNPPIDTPVEVTIALADNPPAKP
jgi:hypothetical protein